MNPSSLGVVTETQWRGFCEAFDLPNLLAEPAFTIQSLCVADRAR